MEMQLKKVTKEEAHKMVDEVEGDTISQKVYVTNGNPNFESAVFSPINAVIIGLITTAAAGLGTYVIVKMSEKNVQISDDED